MPISIPHNGDYRPQYGVLAPTVISRCVLFSAEGWCGAWRGRESAAKIRRHRSFRCAVAEMRSVDSKKNSPRTHQLRPPSAVWAHKRFSSMLVVLPPVFEFLFDSIADLHAQILGQRDIPFVEKDMQIRSKQKPVRDQVWPGFRVGPNVICLQHRQGAFACDGTAPVVGICHQHAECALAEARMR